MKATVVITVQGGMVQNVVSNVPDMDYIVKDYDTQEGHYVDQDGEFYDSLWFSASFNPEYIAKTQTEIAE